MYMVMLSSPDHFLETYDNFVNDSGVLDRVKEIKLHTLLWLRRS